MSTIRLVIDASSLSGSICLARIDDSGTLESIISSKFTEDTGTHSTWLLSSIKELLDANNISPNDICSYGLTNGPGSFTGLRIAVNALKGLAYSKNDELCVYTVSSMKSLALNVEGEVGSLICPVLDARRFELYGALYKIDGKNSVQTILKDHIVSSKELLSNLSKYKEKIIFLGAGVELIRDDLDSSNLDYCISESSKNFINSEKIANLTTTPDCSKTTPNDLKPAYIRRAEDVFKKASNK